MKIVYISGINGLIGSRLNKFLSEKEFDVRAIERKDFAATDSVFEKKLNDADIIINLAGAPISKRWTKKNKQELINSRILTTRKIANAIINNSHKPSLFISNSAVGIYDEEGRQNEDSKVNPDDFLKELCINWENEALKASSFTNVAICRLGVVLDKNGGALKKMIFPFKLGLGGKIGNGNQTLSWIHISDLLKAYLFIIDNSFNGVYNFTAPQPITNKNLTKILAKQLNTNSFLTVPAFILKIIYGDGAMVITHGQNVFPENLMKKGFCFIYPDFNSAIKDLL